MLPDPVPLGVAGIVTVPRAVFLAADDPPRPLLDDAARLALLSARLQAELVRPLAGPKQLARLVLDTEARDEAVEAFAGKMLETLRDGRSHNTTAVVASTARFALIFIAWNGTHREVLPERYGRQLPAFLSTASRIAGMVESIGGFLEINAFVRDEPDPDHPAVPPAETLAIDIEYAYLPGGVTAGVKSAGAPRDFVLNVDLMTAEQRRRLNW